MTAFCIGIPPNIPPCGWSSESDSAAEKHTRETKHSTTSGTQRGAEVVRQALERKTA